MLQNQKVTMIKYLIAAGLLLSTAASAQQGSVFVGGLARIEENGKSWYINTRGEKVSDQALYVLKDEQDLSQAFYVFSQRGKLGLMNTAQRIVLAPEYDEVTRIWQQFFQLKKENKTNLADATGKVLFPWQFEEIGYIDGNYFDVRMGKQWGIYSVEAQRLVIPAAYEEFDYCGGCGQKGDYLFAKKNGKWGVINFRNETLLPFEYEHEHYFMRSDNWIRSFKRGGQEVVINLATKKEYNGNEYTEFDILPGGLLKAKHNGLFGLIDAEGRQVVDFRYDDIYSLYDERYSGPLIGVVKDGKHGIILPSGKEVIPPAYASEIRSCGEQMIVEEEGMYQLLDSAGKPLLSKHYTAIEPVYTGRGEDKQLIFLLKQQAVTGFYNPRTGRTAAPAFYELEATADGRRAIVEYQGQYGLYDLGGDILLPVSYSEIVELAPDLFLVADEQNRRGLYDAAHRKMQIPQQFRSILTMPGSPEDFLTLVDHEDGVYRYGIYDKDYKQLLPAVYADILSLGKGAYMLREVKGDSNVYSHYNIRTKQLQPLKCLYAQQTEVPGHLMLTGADAAGVIDENGKPVLPMEKQMIHPLKNRTYQVIKVQKDGSYKYGYADSTGKMIVPVIYDYSGNDSDFEGDGLLLVRDDKEVSRSKVGLATTQGLIKLPIAYQAIMEGKPGPGYIVLKGKQFQVLNAEGKPLTPMMFDDVALDEVLYRNATLVPYSLPVMVRTGNVYQYLTAEGTFLPLKLTGVIPFQPSYEY